VSEPSPHVVSVEILGQRYPIRSSLDPRYVAALAAYVDEKMRAAAETVPAADPVRLAVLAALNIADEYFRCRDVDERRSTEWSVRAAEVERLIDQALGRVELASGGEV
jgi:cell division protein ZapA